MYKNKLFHFDYELLWVKAETLFRQRNGLDKLGVSSHPLEKRLTDSYKRLIRKREPGLVVSYFEDNLIKRSGNTLTIMEIALECPAFGLVDLDCIKGAYVYFISAGQYSIDDKSLTGQFVKDIWESAMVDAVRVHFQTVLHQETDLSEEFGPGFFGMRMDMMHCLKKLTDPSLIGIEVMKSGMLQPEKACGGILFPVTKDYVRQKEPCRDCYGNGRGCRLCSLSKWEIQ